MKNFLYKEFSLCLSPINYVFLLFVGMMLIPNYPCYVSLFYLCLSVFFIFNNGEINKDMEYSLILPITKKEIVKSRCVLVFAYEIIGIILIIPFAFLSNLLMPSGNLAGIDGNVAFFGFALILLTVFHFIFFTCFYKRASKPGLPFLFGSIGFWLAYGILEFPIWTKNIFGIPFFNLLDSTDFESQIKQLPVLCICIVIYVIGWILTYKKSAQRFEKVDL